MKKKPNSVAYADALESAASMAIGELDAVFEKLDPGKPYECKQVLLAAVTAIVDKYSAMAAASAAEFYEAERADVVGGNYKPLVAQPVDKEVVLMKVRYALRYLFEEARDGD